MKQQGLKKKQRIIKILFSLRQVQGENRLECFQWASKMLLWFSGEPKEEEETEAIEWERKQTKDADLQTGEERRGEKTWWLEEENLVVIMLDLDVDKMTCRYMLETL